MFSVSDMRRQLRESSGFSPGRMSRLVGLRGLARLGNARLGMARVVPLLTKGLRGEAGQGMARPGGAWLGKARVVPLLTKGLRGVVDN